MLYHFITKNKFLFYVYSRMKFSNPVVLIIFFLVLTINNGFSKDVKPKVLVYGAQIEAFAAAIQSAQSGVPTIWVLPSLDMETDTYFGHESIPREDKLIGGIWMNILQEISLRKEKNDSLFLLVRKEINPYVLRKAMDKIIEKQKNLTIIKGVSILKLEHSKKNIAIVLSNKKKLNVLAVVDASRGMDLISFLGAKIAINKNASPDQKTLYSGPIQSISNDYIRTLVAIQESPLGTFGYTQQEVVAQSIDNIFFTAKLLHNETENLPFNCDLGQVVGANAAYCAFFKSSAADIDIRKLQAELLAFDARIIPFEDVSMEDPNYNALQRIFLVNILPWNKEQKSIIFEPNDSVSIVSIRPVMQQLYSRAQLWFVDNTAVYFTTNDMIELLKVIAFRGDELEHEVEKNWKKHFKFSSDFQLTHTLTRYEFAVLLDTYGTPFTKRISLEGIIQR